MFKLQGNVGLEYRLHTPGVLNCEDSTENDATEILSEPLVPHSLGTLEGVQ